jgi:DNA-binding response OmpR family regulator/DNA-binding CsgD family transcriptional regulator
MKTTPETIVLLVDDMPESMGALASELEANGYTTLLAHSGTTALQRLDLVTPDAILLDAMMPQMTGFEACKLIKAQAAWQHIPVIFMTGLSDTEHIVQGFAVGGVDYVVKPVITQEILARLTTHVRNARTSRIAREALDIGGNGVLVVDAQQRIAWQSPQAQKWITLFFDNTSVLTCEHWLANVSQTSLSSEINHADGSKLVARRLGVIGMGECMWLLQRQTCTSTSTNINSARIHSADLTPRESEVLSWVAKGKTNRDVADILAMSPRTVNKHLEHIFQKLGVETRSAATALANREVD